MPKLTYIDLQHRYPGRVIARTEDEVIADAETLKELDEILNRMAADWEALTIEYVEPTDTVSVY